MNPHNNIVLQEEHMEDVYEVDRIIGRRVSIARNTEYLIYWKGYDINECSWVGDEDLECPGAVAQFEQECFQHRKQHPAVEIDYYDNNGMATLIEVGREIFANGVSPFFDTMDDFSFSASGEGKVGAAGRAKKVLKASDGWNRLQRGYKGRIVQIHGSISDTAGNVYYLSRWDDGKSTWESPRAFDQSLAVLTKFENSCYVRERQKLVRLFQQSRVAADPSIMQTREPKYMLERVHARDAVAKPDRQSPARDTSLIDLSTSLLLSGDAASNTREMAKKPKDSHVRRISSASSSGSSEGSSDIPLVGITDEHKRRRPSAHVFIDHVEGSVAKRRRLQGGQGMAGDLDGSVVAVPGTTRADEPAHALGRATDSKCGVCQLDTQLLAGSNGYTCAECNITYHNACYKELAERMELGPVYIDALKQPGFVCWFCSQYGTQSVEEFLTWRIDSKLSPASLAYRVELLGKVDVIVKWKNVSYRHLSWVPFVWLNTTRRSATLRSMKLQIQMGVPAPPLSKCVNSDYCHPACIIGARPADPQVQLRREQQLRKSGTKVAPDMWQLYTGYEKVWVAWRSLDISSATWEAPPSPLEDGADYMEWNDAFVAWRRAELVSLAERRVKQMYHTEYSAQPPFVAGGLMKEYQMAGAQWLLQRWRQRQSAVLADEMGMGKTIQTIAFLLMVFHMSVDPALSITDAIASNTGTFPFLVVVPTTLVDNWMRELRLWAPSLVVAQLSGRSASREVQMKHTLFRTSRGRRDLKCHVVLTSYEALTSSAGAEAMAKVTWQALVVDEGHRLKNGQTKTFQTLRKFRSRMRVVLTGTPLQNNLRELHSVMSFVDPDTFRPGDDSMLSAQTAADIERTKDMVRPYILRRTKADLPNLVPPRYEVILPVSMTGLQRKLYRATLTRNVALLRDIASALHAHGVPSSSEADAGGRLRSSGAKKPAQAKKPRVSSLSNILVEVRRILSHPYGVPEVEPEFPTDEEKHRHMIEACGKLKLLHVLLSELRRQGHRVLLFAQFKDTLSILEDYLDGEGVGYERIDGDTPSYLRQTRVSAFNAPGSASTVFLSSTRTGGLGINLTSADVVIIYDCDYNPHADLQAMARAHRIGQSKPVYVFKLVTQDTAEERIVEMATRKLLLDQLVIQNIDTPDSQQPQEKPGEIEQALRHGASLLFGAAAEEQAEERAIVYDAARIRQLLEQCREAVKVEQEKRASAAADFARVWRLDRDGHMSEATADVPEDVPEDIWALLLEKTDAQGTATMPSTALSTEDINGRLLRARKRKVDYAEQVSNKKSQAQDDGEWAGNMDGDTKKPQAQPSTAPVLVSKEDFLAIVNLHRSRQVAVYLQDDRKQPPMAKHHAQLVVSQFEAIASRSQPHPGAVPGDGSPRLFFPIPANMRLRNKAQLPEQPTSSNCPVCVGVRSHGRDYCPYILDPQFMAGIEKVQQIPDYWRHPYYHNFVVWYIIQYIWFVLGHPQGEEVHRQNVVKWPSHGLDANVYMAEVRIMREQRMKAQAVRRQQTAQLQALKREEAYRSHHNFYRSFELPKKSFNVVGESQLPREKPMRNYIMYTRDSAAYRSYCDKLTASPVDIGQMNGKWLEEHLKWLYGYRMRVLQAARKMLQDKRDSNTIYTNTLSLQFLSMRIEQVRLRIKQVGTSGNPQPGYLPVASMPPLPGSASSTMPVSLSAPVASPFPAAKSPVASVTPLPASASTTRTSLPASTSTAGLSLPASAAGSASSVHALQSVPVARPAAAASSPISASKAVPPASASTMRPSLPASAPKAMQYLPASAPVARPVAAVSSPICASKTTPASSVRASSAIQPLPASAAPVARPVTTVSSPTTTKNGMPSGNSTAPLTSVDIYMYIRQLGDLKTAINTADISDKDQGWLEQLARYMEELRNCLVSILKDIGTGTPILDHAAHLIDKLSVDHQELVAKGDSSENVMKASKEVNLAILRLWSAVKSSLQDSRAKQDPPLLPVNATLPNGLPLSAMQAGTSATVSSPQTIVARSVSIKPSVPATPAYSTADVSHASTTVSSASSSRRNSPIVVQSQVPSPQVHYSANVTASTLPEFTAHARYSTGSFPTTSMPPTYSQYPASATMPMQTHYQSGMLPNVSAPNYPPATATNSIQMAMQNRVPVNMLAMSAQQAEMLALQQRQYAMKPPHPMLTPPNSSFHQPAYPLMTPHSNNLTSFDLACLLCDDPGHQSSSCPFRKDIRVLTRRRVAIDDNHMLAPGIRETTLSIIDLYIQKAYAEK
ncbi:hypothetical protein LPJ68_004698 [Coemansia sp. RSA 1086]|nr:hypothetical protein LPJ68_004698 [Coemansia sp. RSA 1086]